MAFYDFEGREVDTNTFVDLYAPSYFLGENKAPGIQYTQTSKFVEDEIEHILNNHFKQYSDIAKVLAWKIGKIKHLESEKNKQFIYHSDWASCEHNNPLRFSKEFDLNTFAEYLLNNNNINILEDLASNNPQECLRLIRNHSIRGIGTVYLITILFFLSHGKYPIYDRFAMAAMTADEKNCRPGADIEVKPLPSKWDKGFATICDCEYLDYINKLDKLDIDYKSNRRLDRALWVYGHAFNVIS